MYSYRQIFGILDFAVKTLDLGHPIYVLGTDVEQAEECTLFMH